MAKNEILINVKYCLENCRVRIYQTVSGYFCCKLTKNHKNMASIRKTKKQVRSGTIYVTPAKTTILETVALKIERTRSGMLVTHKEPGTEDKYVVKGFAGTNIGKVNIIRGKVWLNT